MPVAAQQSPVASLCVMQLKQAELEAAVSQYADLQQQIQLAEMTLKITQSKRKLRELQL